MDLDDFKFVNDNYGHQVGDKLLKQVGERLRDCIRLMNFLIRRESDVKISRFGGDEFAIVLSEVETVENAAIVANRIISSLQEPFKIDEHIEITVGISIGIACYPFAGETIDQLCQSADMAMYDAKKMGKNTYCFFSEELSIARNHNIMIEAKLRKALKEGDFYLLYQPILNLKTKKVTGIEVFWRCDLKTLYGIPTSEFIYIAEKTGLIQSLGNWVLDKLFEELSQDVFKKHPGLDLHINVLTKQLQNDKFYKKLKTKIGENAINPEMVIVELTETAIKQDARRLKDAIKSLSQSGIKISIDDFGKGSASLLWLKYLPLSSLKIDREFVVDLSANHYDVIITKSIIRLADNLQLDVIAEGIENEYQLHFLIDHHCEFGQGYYFTKPLRLKKLLEYLDETAKD